jgi:hypothetical protein
MAGKADAAADTDPLAALLASLGGEGGGEGGDGDLSGMLEGMMGQLMTKTVLYEPLKELDDKAGLLFPCSLQSLRATQFPDYMKEHDKTLSAEDKKRYAAQQACVKKILVVFEAPGYSDDDTAAATKVVGLMNDVRLLILLSEDTRLFPSRCKPTDLRPPSSWGRCPLASRRVRMACRRCPRTAHSCSVLRSSASPVQINCTMCTSAYLFAYRMPELHVCRASYYLNGTIGQNLILCDSVSILHDDPRTREKPGAFRCHRSNRYQQLMQQECAHRRALSPSSSGFPPRAGPH